jgi:hypothetical protein
MITLIFPDGKPTFEHVAQSLLVDRDKLDETFGVILIDPDEDIYAVRYQADDDEDLPDESYSDPQVAPFNFEL